MIRPVPEMESVIEPIRRVLGDKAEVVIAALTKWYEDMRAIQERELLLIEAFDKITEEVTRLEAKQAELLRERSRKGW